MNFQKKILILLQKLFTRLHLGTGAALKQIRQFLYFIDFVERDSDVYIATFLKSGTTWMQVIVYNLLTDGKMDFEHIYDVSPWIRNQAYKNHSAEKVNALPEPRIIKTHDDYDFFDSKVKGKFIYVYRDGKDIAVSLYHHNKNYRNQSLEFDKNFDDYFRKKGNHNWFEFNKKWFINSNGFEILYVAYESLKNDFDATIAKIAKYLNVELTDEILERVRYHSSFEYMKEFETKFGEQPKEDQVRLYNQFIREGKTGEGEEALNEEQRKYFDRRMKMELEPFLPTNKNRIQLKSKVSNR